MLAPYRSMPSFREKERSMNSFLRGERGDADMKRRLGAQMLMNKFGNSLVMREMAAIANVPVGLSSEEQASIASLIRQEQRLGSGVMDALKKRLDGRALEQVQRIRALGLTTAFPVTPIANEILQRAETPEGLLESAIALRKEYAEFRFQVCELESSLFEEDLTLKQKMRLVRRVDSMAAEIWGEKRLGVRRWTDEATGIATLAIQAPAAPVASVAGMVGSILKLPWETLAVQIHRRRVRVLSKSAKRLLASKDQLGHAANLLKVKPSIIQRSLATGERVWF